MDRDEAVDKLFSDSPDDAAQYKIEVTFGKVRTRMKCVGVVQIFESGTALHGGGDIKIYWCPNDDCQAPMDYSSKAAGQPFCPVCNQACKGDDMVGERFFNMPVAQVAELLEKTFFKLGNKADIYLKFHPTDLRYEIGGHGGHQLGDHLRKARTGRQRPAIYPLRNIIKDTANGAPVKGRIQAFLEA